MNALSFIFWIFLAAALYAYAGYAVFIWSLARIIGRQRRPSDSSNVASPRITLLISAYNEEDVIAQRIQDALRLDYPRELLQIVIASDGSSDETAEIAARFGDRGVVLLNFRNRRGKASALNAAMQEINADLVLLSDANTHFKPDAARKLVRWFSDPTILAVCGRLVLTDSLTGKNVDGLYWKYETFLKTQESRLGALLGANGAIYAIRRSAFVPIPSNTIVDDFVIPLLAKIRLGGRIIYDPEALAFEETAIDVAAEFRRRARIGAGGFQAITILWRLLNPRRGWIAFTFFSHKVLRWLCPFFLLGMLLANALLVNEGFYRYILLAQITFYLASFLLIYLPSGLKPLRPLRLAPMFVGMNAALLVGFFRWLSGRQTGMWKRTERQAIETVETPISL